MFGLLNIDKPFGMTSREVVNRVQRLVRPDKIGHAGTLDPMATGVLIMCVGRATRLNEFLQHVAKRYRASFQLGCCSDTEDMEGNLVYLDCPPRPTLGELQEVLCQFRGEIMQRPPAFSALKVKGQRAYSLARQGRAVTLEPRRVTIDELTLVNYSYPELVLDVTCSSGTYIRSIGRDVGEALGSAAVMSSLRRTAIGPFLVEEAEEVHELNAENIAERLLPAVLAVSHFPQLEVSAEDIEQLGYGRFIDGTIPTGAEMAAAVDADGELIALLSPVSRDKLKPHRFFPRSRKCRAGRSLSQPLRDRWMTGG